MDRNVDKIKSAKIRNVALRKESVDRNVEDYLDAGMLDRSLSARRAWIEICVGLPPALTLSPSLSARRAWIEISAALHHV